MVSQSSRWINHLAHACAEVITMESHLYTIVRYHTPHSNPFTILYKIQTYMQEKKRLDN